MQILHILRSEPDKWVELFIEALSGEEGALIAPLYKSHMCPDKHEMDPGDWDRLVRHIFRSDKVICWW